jgi:hypothetical protein
VGEGTFQPITITWVEDDGGSDQGSKMEVSGNGQIVEIPWRLNGDG